MKDCSAAGKYHFEFYDYTLHQSGDLFYVVGRERGDLDLSGQAMRLAIRTSRIFQRDADAKWRQVHHHGSIEYRRCLPPIRKRPRRVLVVGDPL